jgi:hypothetical protein
MVPLRKCRRTLPSSQPTLRRTFMSIVKSFAVRNGDMFYIQHNTDNFTIIVRAERKLTHF